MYRIRGADFAFEAACVSRPGMFAYSEGIVDYLPFMAGIRRFLMLGE